MTARQLVMRSRQLAWIDHGSHLVVLAIDTNDCAPLRISGGGVGLWHALGGEPVSLQTLIEATAAENDVDADSIDADVRAFVGQLVTFGLAELTDPA